MGRRPEPGAGSVLSRGPEALGPRSGAQRGSRSNQGPHVPQPGCGATFLRGADPLLSQCRQRWVKGRRSAEGQGGGHGRNQPGRGHGGCLRRKERGKASLGCAEKPAGGTAQGSCQQGAGVGNHLLRLPGPTGSSAPSLSWGKRNKRPHPPLEQ